MNMHLKHLASCVRPSTGFIHTINLRAIHYNLKASFDVRAFLSNSGSGKIGAIKYLRAITTVSTSNCITSDRDSFFSYYKYPQCQFVWGLKQSKDTCEKVADVQGMDWR